MISPIHEDLKKKNINFYDNYIIQYCVMYVYTYNIFLLYKNLYFQENVP